MRVTTSFEVSEGASAALEVNRNIGLAFVSNTHVKARRHVGRLVNMDLNPRALRWGVTK